MYLVLLPDLHILREVEILCRKLRHSPIGQGSKFGSPEEEEKHIQIDHVNDLDILDGLELLLAVSLRWLIDGILRKQLDSLEATRHFVNV